MTAIEMHPVLTASPYRGYVYAYPHKTAYRRFDQPCPLADVWADEPRSGLFLYLHVPFCTMRCGFCNLFTTPNPKDNLVTLYLDALRRQAEAVREAMPDPRFARLAIGGGTPTYLDEAGLADLFDITDRVMGVDRTVPVAIETSPDTITADKVALFRDRGVDRVSIGIQSFVETEAANAGRPQLRRQVDAALLLLAGAGLPTLNIDLIYGLPGQTVATWLYSLREALTYAPDELFLYPLYVRPLTGLGRSHKEWDDVRLACYREARELLLDAGYEQVSMRMFQRTPAVGQVSNLSGQVGNLSYGKTAGPRYCCQEDGMVGLGCGARSYTRGLHYSLDFAVAPKGVKGIIADYLARDANEFATAEHGFALDPDEQRRRYLLQSILHTDGLDESRYRLRFGTDPADDFADLRTFADLGLLDREDGRWRPTALGLERSDALGPWFFSHRVQALMAGYEAK